MLFARLKAGPPVRKKFYFVASKDCRWCADLSPFARCAIRRSRLLKVPGAGVGSSMVEQRPFKALVVGSSPTQPNSRFCLYPAAPQRHTGKISATQKNRGYAPKRRNRHENALYLATKR